MKILLESTRHIGKNPFDFLYNNIIPNGSFVSIGYFNDHVISFGSRSRKNITADNDTILQQHLATMPDGSFKKELEKFRNSEKYKTALAKGGTAPLDLEGDCHIVKIGRYIVNWKNPEAFSKFYAKQGDARAKLRSRYGFDGSEYPEGDWHNRYAGTHSRELIEPENTNKGNRYTDNLGNTGFYGNINDPKSVSIRQFSNPKLNKTPEWFFVDASGNIEKLDSKLMNHLAYGYSKQKVKEAIEYLTQEEEAFVNELEALKNSELEERTMLLNNIIYLTGTSLDAKGNKEPFTWLNDEIIMEKYPYMKKEDLDAIIKKCVKVSKDETEDLNESLTFVRNKNFVNEKQQDFVYVNTYAYGKCKAFQNFDMESYRTYYDVYDEHNNYLGAVQPSEPSIDALEDEINNDNFIDDAPMDENKNFKSRNYRHVNEGTNNSVIINKWDNIKEAVGAEQMINEIFEYLPEDEIAEMVDWMERAYDLD